MKTCRKCGETKPHSEYTKHKAGRDGLRSRCRPCIAEANAAYRARTVEQRAAYNKTFRAKNRDRHLAYNRAWNRANPESIRASLRKYRSIHAKRIAIAKALRRRVAHGDRPKPEAVLARIAYYGGLCRYCRCPADTIDHRIPICRGGTNLPANLVPACRSCNSRKRHRTESEWKVVVALSHG